MISCLGIIRNLISLEMNNALSVDQMSLVMRNPYFCLCENKHADQLCSNCTADQRLCFRYTDSAIHLLLMSKNFKLPAFSVTTGQFVSVQVGTPEDRFSQVTAQIQYKFHLKVMHHQET